MTALFWSEYSTLNQTMQDLLQSQLFPKQLEK